MLKPALGGVRGGHFSLPLIKRLNKTKSAGLLQYTEILISSDMYSDIIVSQYNIFVLVFYGTVVQYQPEVDLHTNMLYHELLASGVGECFSS